MIPVIDTKIPCPRCGGLEFQSVNIDPENKVIEYKKCNGCGWAQQTDPIEGGVASGVSNRDNH